MSSSLNVAVVTRPRDVLSAERPGTVLDPIAAQFGAGGRTTATKAVLLRSSYVPGALADYADELLAAIVAMHRHGRQGVAHFALGSVPSGDFGAR